MSHYYLDLKLITEVYRQKIINLIHKVVIATAELALHFVDWTIPHTVCRTLYFHSFISQTS